jgi:hypothetical protein
MKENLNLRRNSENGMGGFGVESLGEEKFFSETTGIEKLIEK